MKAWLLFGLLLGAGSAYAEAGPPRLAVVCYHRFGAETAKDPYRISLERLNGQLDWLRQDGWRSVSLTQVAAALAGDSAALPPKGVMLSVDDGYKAGALGAAAFEAHGYRGVFFVNPGSLGSKAFLHWEDLRALEARGHEVASHTTDHPNLAKVPHGQDPQAYRAWVQKELQGSREALEKHLGHPVTALAWPFGAYNRALVQAARRAGYTQLYTVSGGLNLLADLDGWRLRRILLMGHPPLAAFQRHLGTLPVEARISGLQEGALIFRSKLPLSVHADGPGLSAGLGSEALPASGEGVWTLPANLQPGFHYLVFDQGSGPRLRRTPLLFQVLPDAWREHVNALEQP